MTARLSGLFGEVFVQVPDLEAFAKLRETLHITEKQARASTGWMNEKVIKGTLHKEECSWQNTVWLMIVEDMVNRVDREQEKIRWW